MKGLGIIITIITGAIIVYNIYMCNVCVQVANDRPVLTETLEGKNLPNQGAFYSFYPPLSEFEIGVYVTFCIGLV